MRMGSGGGASSSIASSPRAKASAAAKVAATLSSGDAASRQARAAADSDAVTSWLLWERLQPRSWDSRRQQTPLPLRLVRAQLLDAFEVARLDRSEEHTSELPSLMRTSYAVFSLKKKNTAQ